MARHLILVFSLLIISSCASRKVDVSKKSIIKKIDSSAIEKIDGTYVKNNNIIVTDVLDEIEYTAKDTSMPMVINGKEFKNVVIKSKRSKKVSVDKTKQTAKLSSEKKLNVKKEALQKNFEKKIDKKANYFIYLWLLLIPVVIYIYRQLKKKYYCNDEDK